MATAPQLIANRANAQHSTGPRSDNGKATSARNATKYGLFAAGDYIPEADREEFEELEADLLDDLAPLRPIEVLWFREIVSAAWRLHRCLKLEADEAAEPSVQRTRAQAQHQLARATAELRRLQTERQLRNELFEKGTDLSSFGVASFKEVIPVLRRIPIVSPPELEFAKQTQSAAEPQDPPTPDSTERTQSTPRNAPCPCGSGQKYKRCCGRNAPAVLHQCESASIRGPKS
jgi:hypothetical protein